MTFGISAISVLEAGFPAWKFRPPRFQYRRAGELTQAPRRRKKPRRRTLGGAKEFASLRSGRDAASLIDGKPDGAHWADNIRLNNSASGGILPCRLPKPSAMISCPHFGLLAALVLILQGCAGTPVEPPKIERISAEQLEASLPPPMAALPLEQVVELARQGVTADELIRRITDSASRYRLSASQIVELATQGVPLAVLDHMVAAERGHIFGEMAADANKRDRACRERIDQELRMCRNQMIGPMFMYGPYGPYPGINCWPLTPRWPFRRCY